MRLLVSLLLIPLFVLGQVLPHSHAGTGIVEPAGHSDRPHVHLFGDHQHGEIHDHDEDHDQHDAHKDDGAQHRSSGISAPAEHDSDAVYFPESDWTASRTVGNDLDLSSVPVPHWAESDHFAIKPLIRFAAHPPDPDSTLPVYLLTASLRL